MTVPIHEDDVMKHVSKSLQMGKRLRVVRTIPIDMDVPVSRRNLDECSEQFKSNIAWLQRNLGVRNSEHPQFSETVKKLKILAKKIKI